MDEKTLTAILEEQARINKQMAGLLEKTAAVPPDAIPLHGNGGLWSMAGLDREIINAKIEPFGLMSVLPKLPSSDESPIFGALLGVMKQGSRITEPCEDAPTSYAKGGTLTAKFGLTRVDTNTMDLLDIAMRKHRGDFQDLMLRGSLLGDNFTTGGLRAMSEGEFFTNLTVAEMIMAGITANRELTEDLWQGSIASGAFPGLDRQINTGIIDAYTGATLPALDSLVVNFNYDAVDGSGRDIVDTMHAVEHNLFFNSTHMGFNPTQWVIAMRPELWDELVRIWVCRAFDNRCRSAGGDRMVQVNDGTAQELTMQMKNEQYLEINGRRYDVVLDTGINMADWDSGTGSLGEGEFASSIYFVPLSIQGGGFRTTYMEYKDYSAAEAMLSALQGKQSFWTDGGMYSWGIEDVKSWCVKMALRSEQRVVLRTPQLAAKIQRVKFSPMLPTRTPYQDDKYFLDGGVSMRGKDTYQAVWTS